MKTNGTKVVREYKRDGNHPRQMITICIICLFIVFIFFFLSIFIFSIIYSLYAILCVTKETTRF